MKSNLVCAALACVALALSTTAALAVQGEPISGTSVGLEGDPGSIVITRGVTDGEGHINFGKLLPGKYVAVIDGTSFVAAMDRLHPAAPEKKKSGSSFSLGFGGFSSGGGSSHKSSSDGGAGPVGGAPGGASHGNSHSSGAMGLGVSIPIEGGGGGQAQGGGIYSNAPIISMTLTVSGTPGGTTSVPDARESSFSSETPYCRDTAGQGMRFGFTVTNGGNMSSSDASHAGGYVGLGIKF
ncbi:MAG TPA: hypothetical protein VIJ85_01690 [Rhizomicrobium sp.]